MRASLILGALAMLPVLAHAQAVQSYDLVCHSACTAQDGTTQPAGTVLGRALWDGEAAYVPTDAAGVTLDKVPDPGMTAPLYQPQPAMQSPSVPTP